MAIIRPSLFKLLGAGYLKDRYAADGIHLRWMFDPRLGFPRKAVCLFRRRALLTTADDQGPGFHAQRGFTFEPVTELSFEGLRIRRADGAVFEGKDGGIALGEVPLLFELSAQSADGAACYVSLRLHVMDPGGSAVALAQYLNRDEVQIIDRDSVSFGGKKSKLKDMLAKPKLGLSIPKLVKPEHKELYAELVKVDGTLYRTVTSEWLESALGAMKAEEVSIKDIGKAGIRRIVDLVVRGDHIDRVALTGGLARVFLISWVTAAEYAASKGWEHVACVPAAIDEKNYLKVNADHFGGMSPGDAAKQRILGLMPHGAEPLDEPVFPPARPPTEKERRCRYLLPWLGTLAPWLSEVLTESAGGAKHMSQVAKSMPFTDLGQRPGDPLPGVAATSSMEVRPYNMLLAAATAFPVAQLLGLAYIDVSDVKFAFEGQKNPEWDYMAVGHWDRADIAAWAKKLLADFLEAQKRAQTASPADTVAAQAELLEAMFAIFSAIGELNALLAEGDETGLTLAALKLDVSLAEKPDFQQPTSVTATFEDVSVVEPGKGIVRVDWPLRQRARALVHEGIPVGACIARGKAGDKLSNVLNPVMPELKDCGDVRAAVLPAGPPGAAGTAGTASHTDRAADEGAKYHYGVSEMDPFGRWSNFTETAFVWEDRAPPPAPQAIQASLESVAGALRLRVIFHWDRVRLPPAGFAFHVGLRRNTTLSGSDTWPEDAALRAYWTHFSRTLTGTAGTFRFLGSAASGSTATHDGLNVSITFVDANVPNGLGGTAPRRIYTIDFTGALEVTRDAFLRARVYAGVASEKLAYGVLSDDVAGPVTAEHTDPAIPAGPTLPPEPQLASFADAEGFSTFKLTWPGVANTRYQVLRAAEHEIVKALPATDSRVVAYNAATTPAQRAEQLRAMAPATRKVFAPVSDWLPSVALSTPTGVGKLPVPPSIAAGQRTHIDRLPGRADTLFLYTVMGKSASGEPSAWPTGATGFAAVRVPVASPPTQPVVIGARWQPPMSPPPALAIEGNARAELTVVQPQSGATPGAYEIYRAATAANAVDERKMRRIHIAAPVWQDAGDGPDVARFVDPTVLPWRTYWYSLVARAGTPTALGMRSSASRPVAVETASAAAPAPPILGTPSVSGGTATLTATVDFPTSELARFRVELWRTSTTPRELVVSSVSAPTGTSVTAASATTLSVTFPATGLVSGSTMVLRVRDPLGRAGESAPLSIA